MSDTDNIRLYLSSLYLFDLMKYKLEHTIMWLKRFRKRRGYGVHSPFAFDLITNVFHEHTSYYAYRDIEKSLNAAGAMLSTRSRKIAELLFRLVNRVQPHHMLFASRRVYIPLYMQEAKRNIPCARVDPDIAWKETLPTCVDFLYVDLSACDITNIEKIFNTCVERTNERSVFVFQGICRSREMKILWEKMVDDKRVSVTFDLYEVGILFFDHSRIKQHYMVNF